MIEVQGLTKRYGTFTAVQDLSFTVRPGEVLGLVGPNGAGKTSTLRSLAGIIPFSSGSVSIAGNDLAADPVAAKRRLAFFPDEPRLFDYLTVRQHLAFVARIYGVADYESRAQPLLEELEIADKADLLPGELSRGMKQKLVIACGLLHEPSVMFFDEPLTGLDPLGIRRMKDSIMRRAQAGAAVVLSSHLLHLLQEVCTHVLIVKQGQKIAHGTLAEVVARYSGGQLGVSLEEIFLRATADGSPVEAASPPLISTAAAQPQTPLGLCPESGEPPLPPPNPSAESSANAEPPLLSPESGGDAASTPEPPLLPQ